MPTVCRSAVPRAPFDGGELESLISSERLTKAFLAVRMCIIRAFAGERSVPGRQATPGYVAGCEGKIDDLASFVLERIGELRNQIFAADDLPENYRLYINDEPDAAARQVVFKLITCHLTAMQKAYQIYYMAGNREWRMPQTVLDEYLLLAQAMSPGRTGRRDRLQRSRYHRQAGMPRWLTSPQLAPVLVSP